MLTSSRHRLGGVAPRPHLLPAAFAPRHVHAQPRNARGVGGHRERFCGRCYIAAPQKPQEIVIDQEGINIRTHQLLAQESGFSSQGSADDIFEPLTAIWARNADRYGDIIAVADPHRTPQITFTYRQLQQEMVAFAAGLRSLGLAPGDMVSLFSENSSRWIVADQAVMMLGAANAVRGASVPAEELHYILSHSGSCAALVQDAATLDRLAPALPDAGLRFVVLLWPPGKDGSADGGSLQQLRQKAQVPVLGYEEVIERGRAALSGGAAFVPHPSKRGDLATLVYTSGTTGHPKGVMLSHGNLRYQVDNFDYFLQVNPGETTLALLPPWHIYQRSVAYYLYACAASSTVTDIRHFRDDLTTYPPDHFVCVPLVLETLHAKVMAKLAAEVGVRRTIISGLLAASKAYVEARRSADGVSLQHARAPLPAPALLLAGVVAALLRPLHALANALVFKKVLAALGVRRTVISGGGSLAPHLDLFFEMIGLTVLNGWGLTETSPVLACRRAPSQAELDNVRGSVGRLIPGTQLRVVDPVTHQELPEGEQGLLLARGPGVSTGYWRDPVASSRAFATAGWFDTGDLGWVVPRSSGRMGGSVVLSGRAKDTIVLLSGKNVEPQPIEDALVCSRWIRHAVLLGQDKRELGALLFPDEEALAAAAAAATSGAHAGADERGAVAAALAAGDAQQLEAALLADVARQNRLRPDYHPEDHIAHVQVVRRPLSVDDGTLTRTMKPRRPAITAAYGDEVARLLSRLR